MKVRKIAGRRPAKRESTPLTETVLRRISGGKATKKKTKKKATRR